MAKISILSLIGGSLSRRFVFVMGDNYKQKLLSLFDYSQLPERLGGGLDMEPSKWYTLETARLNSPKPSSPSPFKASLRRLPKTRSEIQDGDSSFSHEVTIGIRKSPSLMGKVIESAFLPCLCGAETS
ncbi:hypothetical protein T484DRAFT_1787503 [Baffinella frigidus]|nr:hypothetical protein T484DRAFT_1787503 [Cryptophyta sp. CCMP2293]